LDGMKTSHLPSSLWQTGSMSILFGWLVSWIMKRLMPMY
jgi:hypothetical protein